jgi:predicted transcriptional regulator
MDKLRDKNERISTKKDMQNQKDTLQYQKDNVLTTEVNSLNIKAFSEYAVKKTEKLVTALYMVTDCMEKEDGIKNRLRTLGVDLLSYSHSFSISLPAEKQNYIDKSNTNISEIMSLIEIANTMGFVSEMNANILKKEFNLLSREIGRFENENTINKTIIKKVYSQNGATLNAQSFEVQLPVYKEATMLPSQFWQGNLDKGQTVLYKNKKDKTAKDEWAEYRTDVQRMTLKKEDRKKMIVDLIKQKGDISIKDISYAFTDCSEKTIQRELNNLVLKGLLKKTGSKRWSRYSITN